jgi:hypothetical protein
MSKGSRKSLKVRPDYGYQHPDCKMQPPPGLPAGQRYVFDLQLVNWYPANVVRAVGADSDMYKLTLAEGAGWETPRAPFEVGGAAGLAGGSPAARRRLAGGSPAARWSGGPCSAWPRRVSGCCGAPVLAAVLALPLLVAAAACVSWPPSETPGWQQVVASLDRAPAAAWLGADRAGCRCRPGCCAGHTPCAPCVIRQVTFRCQLRTPAYNGVHQTGYLYYSSPEPLQLQLGQGRLPEAVEQALSHLAKGERALFIVPAALMAPGPLCNLPAVPGKGAAQVELELELLAMTQVGSAPLAGPGGAAGLLAMPQATCAGGSGWLPSG